MSVEARVQEEMVRTLDVDGGRLFHRFDEAKTFTPDVIREF